MSETEVASSPTGFRLSVSRDGRGYKFIKALYKKKVSFISLVILILIICSCIFAPIIAPYDPYVGEITQRLLPIGTEGHLLGTDEQGRDILSRILYGGRMSLFSGVFPVLIATVIGLALGVTAGYLGKGINAIIMRTLDIFYSFPAVLLAIGISAAIGQGMQSIIIALAVVFVPPIARVAETAVKSVKVEEYIEAAKSSGASSFKVIRYFVLKNIFSKVFVYSTTQIGISLLFASGLSFLGLGVSPPEPEWGIMLNNLKSQIYINPILTVVPGIFIFLSAITINLASDGIRDALEDMK